MECTNPEGVPYSMDQLKQQLIQTTGLPPKMALQVVQEDIEKWCEGKSFPDDVSMLIIESR
jgi:serine phosphatase RsbU (regulator of sigma subunit)